ncbi:hypothetical protein N406_00070 [Helicobacter pylori FD577]|nr:hypothetical protein N406_00070 [Helicobacter pylori FD577]
MIKTNFFIEILLIQEIHHINFLHNINTDSFWLECNAKMNKGANE